MDLAPGGSLANPSAEAVPLLGISAYWDHYWNAKYSSSFGYSQTQVDNRSLQGVAGTAPFKWNGANPSLQIQCGPRFARVLMRTEPFPQKELRDLATFIESLPPPRYDRKRQAKLTPLQERGRAIFFATLINAGGFLAFALSALPPMRQLGILSALAFVLSMLADFTALPASLWILGRHKPDAGSPAAAAE